MISNTRIWRNIFLAFLVMMYFISLDNFLRISDHQEENVQFNGIKEVPIDTSNTIVTAYYKMKSKHSNEEYHSWMKNMLSLNDAMVIFTTDDCIDFIKSMRLHALDKTQ